MAIEQANREYHVGWVPASERKCGDRQFCLQQRNIGSRNWDVEPVNCFQPITLLLVKRETSPISVHLYGCSAARPALFADPDEIRATSKVNRSQR
jgi:hypothetical protein